jgi:hypothetical protein
VFPLERTLYRPFYLGFGIDQLSGGRRIFEKRLPPNRRDGLSGKTCFGFESLDQFLTGRGFRFVANKYYVVGEDVKFPGIDPAHDNNSSSLPSLPNSQGSSTNQAHSSQPEHVRQRLEATWASRRSRAGYQPQLSWNPATGEPWMAVRAYATNSYPALSGEHHATLNAF